METIEWDETRKDDKEFLLQYYQSVADKWKDREYGKKVYQRFQKAADKIRKELSLTPNN